MLLRFIPLLLLPAVAFAAPNAFPYLYKLCISPLIDSPLDNGADPKTRYKKGVCTQKFDLVGSTEERETFCANALPFDAKMTDHGATFTCEWTALSLCPSKWYQIYDSCYRVNIGGNENVPCDDGVLENKFQPHIVRWLSIYFKSYEAVQVGEPKDYLKKEMITDMYYSNGVAHKDSEMPLSADKKVWGLMVSRISPFGLYPGNLIYLEKTATTPRLCVRQPVSGGGSSVSEGGRAHVPNPTSSAQQTGSNGRQWKVGDKTFRVSMNYYQPKLDSAGKVDLDHFHTICKKVCLKCRAASVAEDFDGYGFSGRVWVAVKNNKPANKAVSDCKDAKNALKRKDFRGTIDERETEFIPPENAWAILPSEKCSDGERLAVQYVSSGGKGGFVDVPVFDWQPVMCVSGSRPAAPRESQCFKNSVPDGSGCKCKTDKAYIDVSGTEHGLRAASEFGINEKGYICMPPKKCGNVVTETNQYYGAIIFIVDGSGSIDYWNFAKAKEFIHNSYGYVPPGLAYMIYQFGSTGDNKYWYGKSGISKQEFDAGVEVAIGDQLTGGTATYSATIHCLNQFQQFRGNQANPKPPLVILITDGDPNDDESENLPTMLSMIHTLKGKMIVVAVGVDSSTFHGVVDDIENDVIALSGYTQLDAVMKKKIIQEVCIQYEWEDVLAAF